MATEQFGHDYICRVIQTTEPGKHSTMSLNVGARVNGATPYDLSIVCSEL